jgi:hypothetical protein
LLRHPFEAGARSLRRQPKTQTGQARSAPSPSATFRGHRRGFRARADLRRSRRNKYNCRRFFAHLVMDSDGRHDHNLRSDHFLHQRGRKSSKWRDFRTRDPAVQVQVPINWIFGTLVGRRSAVQNPIGWTSDFGTRWWRCSRAPMDNVHLIPCSNASRRALRLRRMQTTRCSWNRRWKRSKCQAPCISKNPSATRQQ